MKRRDFLLGSAGILGSSVPLVAGASVRPCPPSPFGVKDGSQVVANCSSVTAEQDWINRATSAAVLWAHDFRLQAEVDNFRASQDAADLNGKLIKSNKSPDKLGTGYHTVVWGTDGIAGTNGRSLLTYAPKAFGAGKYFSNENAFAKAADLVLSDVYAEPGAPPVRLRENQLCGLEMIAGGSWNRPFAPLTMTDGSLPADPAAGSSIPLSDWNPNDGNQQSYFGQEKRGLFVHPDYATKADYESGRILGNEFWLQFRVKLNSDRHKPREDVSGGIADYVAKKVGLPSYGKQFPPAGKLAFIHLLGGGTQQIIPLSGAAAYEYYYPMTTPFRWFAAYGQFLDTDRAVANPKQETFQRASPWELTCGPGGDLTQPSACWFWPEEEWVTVLVHIKPGHTNEAANDTGPNRDTLIEFKVARWGEMEYTTIYSGYRAVRYNTDYPLGYGLLTFSCYFNNVPSFRYISHTYTQVILSKQSIPCPQVY